MYRDMPDEQLLDMLAEGEKDFAEGVYFLLVGEANRRGLKDKVDAIKQNYEKETTEKKEEGLSSEGKFVQVYSSSSLEEARVIMSMLNSYKIPCRIEGEKFGTFYGAVEGISPILISVSEEFASDAKELLKDYVQPDDDK